MSQEYDTYLKNHREGVMQAFRWISDNCPCLVPYEVEQQTMLNIMQHDASKNDREEYYAYDKYFNGASKSFKVVDDFNRAWLHHIHNNPHHWQHWVLLEDDPENGQTVKCLQMPEEYVLEMVCDWWSFSFAKGNLREIFDWYDAHKSKMKLHPGTKALVERYLEAINVGLRDHIGEAEGDEEGN